MSKYLTRKEVERNVLIADKTVCGFSPYEQDLHETLLAYMDIAEAAKKYAYCKCSSNPCRVCEPLVKALKAALEKVSKGETNGEV